jgi:putative redox protein
MNLTVTWEQDVCFKAESESHHSLFTDIHIHFKVTGKDLDEKKVARAIELSATKYCSASIMLSKSVNITHGYEIIAA